MADKKTTSSRDTADRRAGKHQGPYVNNGKLPRSRNDDGIWRKKRSEFASIVPAPFIPWLTPEPCKVVLLPQRLHFLCAHVPSRVLDHPGKS